MPTTDNASPPMPNAASVCSLRRGALPAAVVAIAALIIFTAAADEASALTPPQGRTWELVTPPDPHGRPARSVLGITTTGDRVLYATSGSLPGAPAGSSFAPNLAVRKPHGWESTPLGFAFSVPTAGAPPRPAAADEDMSHMIWWSTFPLVPGAPSFPSTGIYSGTSGTPTLLGDGGSGFQFYAASTDLRTLVFQTQTALLPADVRTSGRQVYELGPAGLRLAGVDNAGFPLSACGAIVGADENTSGVDFQPNASSRDGRRIFLSSPDSASCGGTRRVYMRENGATTTEISASRCTRADCNTPRTVSFMGATPSGSTAYLSTEQQLTDDDVDGSRDLYRYDVASGVLTRVTVAPPGVPAGVVPTSVFTSDDGSRVYFVATGALVPGAPAAGRKIYVADDRGIRYVAPLADTDRWATSLQLGGVGSSAGIEGVQLTGDGSRLLFASVLQITADDTDASKDVYLYDWNDDTVTRVSAAAGNGNGGFDADFMESQVLFAPAVPAAPLGGHPRRSLTDDGRRVFFTTAEALVDADENTTPDVYEWSEGDLRLVTSGAPGSDGVLYRWASADGSTVFFATNESLVPADDDGGDADLYAAREAGGFPPTDPAPTACSGGGCAEQPFERLHRPVPATVGFGLRRRDALQALPISSRARRRAAISGQLRLRVRVRAPGRVVARALSRIAGRTRIVARSEAAAGRAGAVLLRLRLSSLGRRQLSRTGTLRLRIVLRRQRPDRAAVVRLTLEAPR
jgi:hypothetical protein